MDVEDLVEADDFDSVVEPAAFEEVVGAEVVCLVEVKSDFVVEDAFEEVLATVVVLLEAWVIEELESFVVDDADFVEAVAELEVEGPFDEVVTPEVDLVTVCVAVTVTDLLVDDRREVLAFVDAVEAPLLVLLCDCVTLDNLVDVDTTAVVEDAETVGLELRVLDFDVCLEEVDAFVELVTADVDFWVVLEDVGAVTELFVAVLDEIALVFAVEAEEVLLADLVDRVVRDFEVASEVD